MSLESGSQGLSADNGLLEPGTRSERAERKTPPAARLFFLAVLGSSPTLPVAAAGPESSPLTVFCLLVSPDPAICFMVLQRIEKHLS